MEVIQLELLQLKYFVKLVETSNLSKTAQELMISAPSLSSTIRRLEKELGVELFDRSQYRIQPNKNGLVFYHYVKTALNSLDFGISAIQADEKPTLRLALTNFPIWSELIYAFEKLHPEIEIDYSLITLSELNDHSRPFGWDFFLGVIEDVDQTLFESRKVYASEMPLALMSSQHPLAHRSAIYLEELRNDPFISTKMVNSSAHRYMMSLCRLAGFEPNIAYYADYLMRNKLLEQNRGVNVATGVGWNKTVIQSDKIVAVPISRPTLPRTQAVSWRKGKLVREIDRQFLQFVEEYVSQHPLS